MTIHLRDETLVPLAVCRHALDNQFPEFEQRLPHAPRDPHGWFNVLGEIVIGRPCNGTRFTRIKHAAQAKDPTLSAEAIERYALLQAFQITLPRLSSLPVPDAVKSLFHKLCIQIATGERRWRSQSDEISEHYAEAVMMATLRYFFAGELSFEIGKVARSWLAKTHPFDLPQLLMEIVEKYEGFGPFIRPHICRWRRNTFCLQKHQYERSLWLIAKTVAMQPAIKGLLTDSWLYSTEVGETSPHLAWFRDFYAERGGFIVEMELADPNAGFLVGSTARRRLYAEKKFHPRQTIILWSRERMLEWAAAHPELGEPETEDGSAFPPPPAPPTAVSEPTDHLQRPIQASTRRLRSGQLTLIRATRFLEKCPRLYLSVILLAPALSAATCATLLVGVWAAIPTFTLAFTIMWLFQYFFLQ